MRMTEPSVCCLLLTADRQRFTDRAVECFLSQTYKNAHLLIYDTGEKPYINSAPVLGAYWPITIVYNPSSRGKKIGALRNEAIDMVKADIIVHWDSDDWSASRRVEFQVAVLEDYEYSHGNGHAATGYHNLLFLDTRRDGEQSDATEQHLLVGRGLRARKMQAWEYDYLRYGGSGPMPHVLGSSLVYWRDTWKAAPFVENLSQGEDSRFCKAVEVHAVNGVGLLGVDEPMLIAEVHGGNTSSAYGVFDRHQPHVNPEWRRAPEWDDYCRERLYP